MSVTKVSYSMIDGAPINVKDFGAKGDGVTNDTAAIQAAANVGGVLFFPAGTYEITHVDLYSNTEIVGESWDTIIHQISGTDPRPGAYDGMFTVNYANNATPTKNVVFKNLQLKMDLPVGTYTPADEQSHIILTGHTEDVVIDNVYFNGWRGDAVFIGGQMSGVGVPTNYVAQNTSITNCFFNGINNTCRQGITVGSSDGVYINANRFLNVTNATMPGAIDIEPELPFAYGRNITISNNSFVGVGPSGDRRRAVVIDFGGQDAGSIDRRGNINIINNYMNLTNGFWSIGTKLSRNVSFCGNWVVGTEDTMSWVAMDGFVAKDNYFEDCKTILIGFSVTGNEVKNGTISGNTFNKCGIDAAGLQINTLLNGTVSDNQFIDCGGTGDATAIRLASGGTQFGLSIHDNIFTAPTGVTTNSLISSGTQDAQSIFHDNVLLNSIPPPVNWQGGAYLGQDGLLSVTTVSFAANGNTTLYTVPPLKRVVLTKAIVIAGSDAGATTTISIGRSGATTDFIPANTLSNLDAADDAVILMPVPNTTPEKIKYYPVSTVIEATVGSQSGGATNTVMLFGVLYNA
jgi:hypothetical protein